MSIECVEHQILEDLSEHAVKQAGAVLRRSIQLVPDGYEAAFLIRVCRDLVVTIAESLPFEQWEGHDLQARTQALLGMLNHVAAKKDLTVTNRGYQCESR